MGPALRVFVVTLLGLLDHRRDFHLTRVMLTLPSSPSRCYNNTGVATATSCRGTETPSVRHSNERVLSASGANVNSGRATHRPIFPVNLIVRSINRVVTIDETDYNKNDPRKERRRLRGRRRKLLLARGKTRDSGKVPNESTRITLDDSDKSGVGLSTSRGAIAVERWRKKDKSMSAPTANDDNDNNNTIDINRNVSENNPREYSDKKFSVIDKNDRLSVRLGVSDGFLGTTANATTSVDGFNDGDGEASGVAGQWWTTSKIAGPMTARSHRQGETTDLPERTSARPAGISAAGTGTRRTVSSWERRRTEGNPQLTEHRIIGRAKNDNKTMTAATATTATTATMTMTTMMTMMPTMESTMTTVFDNLYSSNRHCDTIGLQP